MGTREMVPKEFMNERLRRRDLEQRVAKGGLNFLINREPDEVSLVDALTLF